MKYKGMNENTIRKMLQSNETALLQKGVTDMLNTITNTTDSLLSSFSIEKFFSNKNFSDLSAFVKDILKQVEELGNKASNANVINVALEKSITDYMKQINVNTKKTSESVNKIITKNQSDKQNLKDIDLQAKAISDGILGSISALKEINETPIKVLEEVFTDNIASPIKEYFSGLKNSGIEKFNKSFPLLSKVISNLSSDYTEEQTKEEEKQRSLKQNKLAEEQVGWLQGSLMPWLKKFGEEQRLESDGFIATFFPMLASMINASPLLLKLIGFGKLFLGIAGGIFGAVKFVEGIGKAVDVLGHEIDFTSLHGWLEALNLGLGNIVSSITGIDLKTVYNWLHNFDRTLSNAYKRYLQPIIGSLWKTIKSTLESAYNTIFKPVIDKVNEYFDMFAEKFPAISQNFENLYNWLKNDLGQVLINSFDTVRSSLSNSINSLSKVWSDTSDTNEYKEIIEIFKSPIETISLEITEIMKYIGTIYTMFSEMGSWKDLFDKNKWAEAYEKVSESSLYTGNQYSDEIYGLKKDRERMNESLEYIRKLSEGYEKMTIQGMGISGEDIAEKGFLKAIRDRLGNEADKSRFDRILEDMNIQYGSENSGQVKEVFEAFRKERLQMFQSDFDSHNKKIDDINKKIEMYENLGRQEKFIGDQIRAGRTRIEAEKLWNKYEERTSMNMREQAEAEIEKEKSIQPTINANGSGNVITNNNYNNTTSNVQSGLNEQQMMESAKNTAN